MKRILKYILVSILLVVLLVSLFVYINLDKIKIKYLSKQTGYQETTVEKLLESSTFKEVQNIKYSKTLDLITNTSYFNKELLTEYLNIFYIETESFLNNINILLDKGYKSEEINKFFQKLKQETINILLEENYLDNITNILDISYFKENNFKRYISYYKENTKKEIDAIITNVNIGLDNAFYTNISTIEKEEQDDLLVLVNKYNKLSKNYVPSNLKTVSSGSAKLRKDAKEAFDKMAAAAKKDGLKIYGSSGYRSYNHQSSLYNNYVKEDGKAEADTYSARAGHSEHQTGLAIDITKSGGSFISNSDKEFTWLKNNSYKYGFILRYPKGKENITGYMYEPWHYRYLGEEVAKEVYEANLTYEEYVAKK